MNVSDTLSLARRGRTLLPLLVMFAACGRAPEGSATAPSTQPATASAASHPAPETTPVAPAHASTTTTASPASDRAAGSAALQVNPLDLADPADAAGQRACRALAQSVPLGPLANQPLRTIVAELQRATGVEFTLLPGSTHHITAPETPIYLPPGAATVHWILNAIPDVEWTVHEGRIVIGPADAIHREKYYVTRRYDVSFIAGAPDSEAAGQDLLRVVQFGGAVECDFSDGDPASIWIEQTTLTLTQTAYHQARAKALLDALRLPLQAVQVRYDARDLLTAPPGSARDTQVARLLKVLRLAANLGEDPAKRITEDNGTIRVTAPRAAQQAVARCLLELRRPADPPAP